MDVYQRMKELGCVLPPPPAKGGAYASVKPFGERLIYVSGCGPVLDKAISGKLGREIDIETGMTCARNSMLNVLSAVQREIGDLNRIKSVVKILCFVNSADDFDQQPVVANGATLLLAELFGEQAGLPARSAIGVNVLPGNIPVEIEAIFELKD
ncbi:MAG: RidA family protein [Clostridia bacterium]|nr:RidA family protein [Clostridia bacterium]